MTLHRLALLATGLSFAATAAGGISLTVQVVNDSDKADADVYLLLTGQPLKIDDSVFPIDVSGIAVADSTGGHEENPPVDAQALNSMTDTNQTVTSQFTGKIRPIYEFEITTLASGVLFVSYDQPITWSRAAPTPKEKFRFDKMEVTYDERIDKVADLTTIDFFGIPMQMEDFSDLSGDLSRNAVMTFYTSSATLAESLDDLVGSPGGPAVFRDTKGNPWDPAKDDFTNFARMLAPGYISSTKGNGSPAPYPSFDGYLDSLLKADYTFVDSGRANGSVYHYTGSIASDGKDDGKNGYIITLRGTTDPQPPDPLPDDATITIFLPNGNAKEAKQGVNLDHFIYGAVLSYDSFSLSDWTPTEDDFNLHAPNSVYGWIVADVLSGLNFGYLNGKYGDDVTDWYKVPPTAFPFGGARTTNDGFYNPWAALVYNNSDSYGFAFSDRSGPSPGMPLQNGDTLRITILPDHRLDAPQVSVTDAATDELSVSWPAVDNATDYEIELMPPYPAQKIPVMASPGAESYTHTFPDLEKGTRYTISVVAIGEGDSNNPVQSVAIPVKGATLGDVVPTTGDIGFRLGFNWANPKTGDVVSINGSTVGWAPGIPPAAPTFDQLSLTGEFDTNYYVLRIEDADKRVIFHNNVVVTLEGTTTEGQYDLVPPFFLGGSKTSLTQAGDPANTPPYTNIDPATVGVPFTPLADKAILDVKFPVRFRTKSNPSPRMRYK
jgi:hypothetical protein